MAREHRRFHDWVQCRKIRHPELRKDSASPRLGITNLGSVRIAFHGAADRVPPVVVKFGNWPAQILAAIEMRRSFRITLPMCACRTSFDFNSDRTRFAFFGSQEITMRDCDSLNKAVAASL